MTPSEPAPRGLRLDLALQAGLSLPEGGTIAVWHPSAGEDFGPLPRERLRLITPQAPDHAAFAAAGLAVSVALEGAVAASVVCLPRSRAEARDLIARACAATSGPVIVDGQKTDGADALLRDVRGRVALSEALSKGHGKIAWFPSPGEALADWRAAPAVLQAEGRDWHTLPGMFSADGVDPASALLADALPAGLKGVAVDLGAGWGYLSARLLAKAPGLAALHLVESDARALDCARANVSDPRAVFHWADATRPLPRLLADAVIMNPPFHQGRAARPQLGAAFITAAAAMLKPSGQVFLVANRHLPYEAALTAAFRKVTELPGSAAFKLVHAEGPIKTAAAPRARKVLHSGARR